MKQLLPVTIAALVAVPLVAVAQTTTRTTQSVEKSLFERRAEKVKQHPNFLQQATAEQKLRDLRRRWDKAFELKDADTQASFFAVDGIFIAGGSQPFEGREAYRDSLLRVFQRPNILLTHKPTKVEVSSSVDMAYELGSWKETWNEPDGLTTLIANCNWV